MKNGAYCLIKPVIFFIIIGMVMGCEMIGNNGDSATMIEFDSAVYEGITDKPVVTVRDNRANRDTSQKETIQVRVYTEETDTEGEALQLIETGEDTGVFTASVGLERLFSNHGYVGVVPGNEKVSVYADGWIGNQERLLAEYSAQGAETPQTAEAFYEEPKSTVSGIVKDQSGAIVEGASVRLYNSDSSVDYTVGSRSDGAYAFYDIPSGIYTIKADKNGYLYVEKLVSVP
jgi:hypothetical protein